MIAGNRLLHQAKPLLTSHRRELVRALMAPFVLLVAWSLVRAGLPSLAWIGVVLYGIAQLALLALARWKPHRIKAIDSFALFGDVLLAGLLILLGPLIGSAIYPLYAILALRVQSMYQRLPGASIIAFAFGPIYLFANALARQSTPPPMFDHSAQWLMLLGSLGFGAVAILASAAQRRDMQQLRVELREANKAADMRVMQLQNTTDDLRARMREQHALEEGLRVITSTLSLDEVLPQIVESAMQMFGNNRVRALALSLPTDDGFDHHMMVLDGNTDSRWANILAQRVMHNGTSIVSSVERDQELAAVVPDHMRSVLSVPLILSSGAVGGALTVGSEQPTAFSSSDARHLNGFAMQAGIAISNAELHSQIRRQQRLLGSVIRDINDGLVVMDAEGSVVLANPLGTKLLDEQVTNDQRADKGQVRTHVLEMASSISSTEATLLTYELQIGDGEEEERRFYQALASPVHQQESDEPLTAVVLHDITAHKDEERSRSEFISMVSHELRNPLNSLNGFVKIVLQGRAGPLNDMQQEFLTIADGQIEQLKGRISELLEFNRLEAGRLVLNPKWNHIPLLVTGTVTRLRLQAEQNGLTLVNEVAMELPECLFDSERIGQVLTNLVENAIKATPPGGTITVRSELHEREVWLRVCDTGVGIAPDDQSKIFQAFYRAHDRASSKGNHLGLGLAICQQIVVGHNGRIWVESEQGRGSCFSFALPYEERAIELGE